MSLALSMHLSLFYSDSLHLDLRNFNSITFLLIEKGYELVLSFIENKIDIKIILTLWSTAAEPAFKDCRTQYSAPKRRFSCSLPSHLYRRGEIPSKPGVL